MEATMLHLSGSLEPRLRLSVAFLKWLTVISSAAVDFQVE
jgi:hypothetical protein